MGEFQRVAQAIAERLSVGESFRANDVPFLVEDYLEHDEVNCYPGVSGDRCHRIAYFISLNSAKNAKGSGHLHFQKILDCLVQHMQGRCQGITQVAVIITDSWDARTLDKWEHNIEKIKLEAHLELYIFAEGQALELPI